MNFSKLELSVLAEELRPDFKRALARIEYGAKELARQEITLMMHGAKSWVGKLAKRIQRAEELARLQQSRIDELEERLQRSGL